MNPFPENQVKRITDALRKSNEDAAEMRQLLIETENMVMLTEENLDWLERRNRLLGWTPVERYDKP